MLVAMYNTPVGLYWSNRQNNENNDNNNNNNRLIMLL